MERSRLFVLNEPNAIRLSPFLASEIGLNESIMLLQVEFWISISDNEHDGMRWTYQSVRDMQEKVFPFWSISTIQRTVQSLLDRRLLVEGDYNTQKYDRTRWFALGEGLKNLAAIRMVEGVGTRSGQNETRPSQDGTRRGQNGTRSGQNGTTIPETTTEITSETTTERVHAAPSGRRVTIKYSADFEEFWKTYPRRLGKKPAFGRWMARLNDPDAPATVTQLLAAARNYAEVCKIEGRPANYIMQPETFLGPNERYLDYVNPECVEVAKREARRNRTSGKPTIDNGSYEYTPWATE